MEFRDFLIAAGFTLFIGLVICAFLMAISAAFQNQNIREEFCENEGFEGQIMGSEYYEGYCYKTQGETATNKDFFCEPSFNPLTPIGKCKFLEVNSE